MLQSRKPPSHVPIVQRLHARVVHVIRTTVHRTTVKLVSSERYILVRFGLIRFGMVQGNSGDAPTTNGGPKSGTIWSGSMQLFYNGMLKIVDWRGP